MWNEDEVSGKGKRIKGKIKEEVGDVINNPQLEQEGESEQVEGNVQENFGKVRRKTGEAIQDVGKAISGKR